MTRYRFNTGPGTPGVDIGLCFDIEANTRSEAVEIAKDKLQDFEAHLTHERQDVSFYVNDLSGLRADEVVDEEEI